MKVLVVSNLSKGYKQYNSKLSKVLEFVTFGIWRAHTLNWILNDISFTLNKGEALGIIGINGAGKSTLLKLITGVSNPTSGTVNIYGTVSSLLELGIGFHPDFTGYQNAIMAGQLLGYSAREIENLMPEIIEFSELGTYINSPIRLYSSGMQVRLAFSIATAKRPDVLIVDEALSVGDAHFQHKSFQRIRSFQELGSSLLIVSHDKAAIQSICDKAILIDGGVIKKEGTPLVVMDYYNALISDIDASCVSQIKITEDNYQTLSGNGEVFIQSVEMFNNSRNNAILFEVGESVEIRVVATTKIFTQSLVVGFTIKDRFGLPIYGTNTYYLNKHINNIDIDTTVEVIFKLSLNIGIGMYSLSIALHPDADHQTTNFEWRDGAKLFEVINTHKQGFVGAAWIPTEVSTRQISYENGCI